MPKTHFVTQIFWADNAFQWNIINLRYLCFILHYVLPIFPIFEKKITHTYKASELKMYLAIFFAHDEFLFESLASNCFHSNMELYIKAS